MLGAVLLAYLVVTVAIEMATVVTSAAVLAKKIGALGVVLLVGPTVARLDRWTGAVPVVRT